MMTPHLRSLLLVSLASIQLPFRRVQSFSSVSRNPKKSTWKIFVDLQCPFARKAMQRLPELKKAFGDNYEFSTHLTSLAFHPQAFTGQQAAYLIGLEQGEEAKQKFIEDCFRKQDRYTNDALGDCRKSEVDRVFGDIAEEAGVLDESSFSRADFDQKLHDWDRIVKPTYGEHKVALAYGVFGTPKHVIDEQLVANTESSWGAEEWRERLTRLAHTI